MNDENDLSILANAVSQTLSSHKSTRRRSCIQKDSDKRSYENDDETRTSRKHRRVSFSSRIQIKTIDDSLHDPNCLKDQQTKENTKANKLLADISNTSKTEVNISINKTEVSLNESVKKKPTPDPCNETFLPSRNYLDVSNLNQTALDRSQQNISMDLANNSNSFINTSNCQTAMDNSADMSVSVMEQTKIGDISKNMTLVIPYNDLTISPSQMSDETLEADTDIDSKLDEISLKKDIPINNENTNLTYNAEITITKEPTKTDIQIIEKTVLITEELTGKAELNKTELLEENPRNFSVDKSLLNMHAQELLETCPNEKTLLTQENESTLRCDIETDIEPVANEMTLPVQESETTMGYDITNYSISNNSVNNSKLLQSILQTTVYDVSESALDLTVGGCSNEQINQMLQSNFVETRDLLLQKIEQMKKFKYEYEQHKKEVKIHNENAIKEDQMRTELNKGLKEKYNAIREKISKLKVENCLALFETVELKDEKDLEELTKTNDALEKSLVSKKQNLADLKEKIRSNSDRIKSNRSSQIEKEKFKEICEVVFDQNVIDFKLVNLEKDTILLSFFHDFIQLEIKATNIVNDLNSYQQKSSDLNSLNSILQKCTKYPIQKLTTRSLVDSVGNSIDSPFYMSDQDRNLLKKQNSKRVPVYIRYCVNLILEDIGDGDLMCTNKRYKYIKDIQLLMAHFSLACKCAENLAKDFEYFASKSQNTEIKCDFDFSNHMVTITLPSLEDYCFYKLKLNIMPGNYYQEAIPFSIEPLDPNDVFQPNIKRLSKVIEGQYFEDGSLINFLRKLKLIRI